MIKSIGFSRVLALDYGADLVYTEEIVDQKLLSSKRIINGMLKSMGKNFSL